MSIETILAQSPVVPVIVVDRLEQAIPLAQALVEGGLPVLEVTLRSDVALKAIERMAHSVSDAIVGVGTITRPDQFQQAIDAGARFAVSPGLTDELIEASQGLDLPFLPGVFTPTEAMHAWRHGFDLLKLFPAQQAGGIAMLKAMAGPLPDLRFCPTGGVGEGNFRDFLALPNVICAGGSWVCPPSAVQAGDWHTVRNLASAVRAALSTSE